MSGYSDGPTFHPSYGSAGINNQLHPVWEGAGFFAARALGPIIRSNGYPGPATLPAGLGGSAMGYGSAGAGFNWKLAAILVAVSAVGILIIHHLNFRG